MSTKQTKTGRRARNLVGVVAVAMMMVMTDAAAFAAIEDEKVVARAAKTISDRDGDVKVTVEWLRRPGEFALTIDYHGYLTQEGMVNAWVKVNGIEREFVTMREELPGRVQRIRILSFHPTATIKGVNRMRPLVASETVDHMLFRNAPYYQQFGDVAIEMKFFAHGRWDGDGNRNDENYVFRFTSPITGGPADHF